MATRARIRGIALLTFLIPLTLSGLPSLSADEEPKPAPEKPRSGPSEAGEARDVPGPGDRVERTDAEWRRRLTALQYMVTRQKATEQAWSGKYARGHFKGTFTCVCCGADLFAASHKFESGTGWPSFWRPVRNEAVATAPDYTASEPRLEVACARCDAHLGHVFSDGPAPTGLRFCINSAALKLQPSTSAAPAKSGAKAKGKSRAKAKSKAKGDEDPNGASEPQAEAPSPDAADSDAASSGGQAKSPGRAPSEDG